MSALGFVCANWNSEGAGYRRGVTVSCIYCSLVAYCSWECRYSHKAVHEKDCKSELGRGSWRPGWVLENRKPSFIGRDKENESFDPQLYGKKDLWGTIPAIDVLALESNEGKHSGSPLNLLISGSGDLRDVVNTISRLSCNAYYRSLDYSGVLNIVVNDHDFDILARNIIMLLIALEVENESEAADCIVHIWYSALIRESDLMILQQRVRPHIQHVCDRLKGEEEDADCRMDWPFGHRTLRVGLQKSQWDKLLSFVSVPVGLTAMRAKAIRLNLTLHPMGKDFRDWHVLYQTPAGRLAKRRFREDGLLLPYGHPRHEFVHPNPTIFQDTETWPMVDNADPIDGWRLEDVESTSSGPATADIYGKLYYYVQGALRDFYNRLTSTHARLELTNLDVSRLPKYFGSSYFDRVVVSDYSEAKVADLNVIVEGAGMHPYGDSPPLISLLKSRRSYTHSTAIFLFRNVVEECMADEDLEIQAMAGSESIQRALKYFPFNSVPTSLSDPNFIRFREALDVIRTDDSTYDGALRNLSDYNPDLIFHATMKTKNTVVEKWPFRLKLRPGQPGAQEELERLLRSGLSGKEVYVEWKDGGGMHVGPGRK